MHFAKLNNPPLSIKPHLKSAWKNKPPGGLIEGLRYVLFEFKHTEFFYFSQKLFAKHQTLSS